MPRNDSILYSGTNGITGSPKVLKQRDEIKTVSKEVSSQLRPALELVTELITAEQDKVRNIEYFDVDDMIINDQFKNELMARKKYIHYLKGLQKLVDKAFKEYNS